MNNYKKHLRNFIQFFKLCWTYHLKEVLYYLIEHSDKALRHAIMVLTALISIAFILATPILFLFTPVLALIAMGIEWVKGGKR